MMASISSEEYEDNLSRLFLSEECADSRWPLILSVEYENSLRPLCERGL